MNIHNMLIASTIVLGSFTFILGLFYSLRDYEEMITYRNTVISIAILFLISAMALGAVS